MRRPLIDQRFKSSIRQFWPSLCTIQRVVNTKDDANQDVPGSPETIDDLIDIPCRLGPASDTLPTDKEMRTPTIDSFVQHRYLKLDGLFPQIVPGMLATVDGITYPIVGVDSDSQKIYTRLNLEVISI